MSIIKKTYEQIHEFNGEATTFLKKNNHIGDKGELKLKKDYTKLDHAIFDLLMKQIVKKHYPAHNKKVVRIEIANALTDPTTKKLMVAERANPKFGIMTDTYDYSPEGKKACLDAIDALDKDEYDINQRPVPEVDLPELTEEEREAFITSGFILIEPKKAEEK